MSCIKSIIVLVFFSFLCSESQAVYCCGPSPDDCKSARQISEVIVEDGFQRIVRREHNEEQKKRFGADSSEQIIDQEVKCKINLKSSNTQSSSAGVLYTKTCPRIHGPAFFTGTTSGYCGGPASKVVISENNQKVLTRTFLPSRQYYMWQKGECTDLSKKYFYKLKMEFVTTVKKLEKNKFLLVAEDEKSLTYYANPGYFVKLEKNEKICKKNKNCELNILIKTRLSGAILDADGKLYTDESI